MGKKEKKKEQEKKKYEIKMSTACCFLIHIFNFALLVKLSDIHNINQVENPSLAIINSHYFFFLSGRIITKTMISLPNLNFPLTQQFTFISVIPDNKHGAVHVHRSRFRKYFHLQFHLLLLRALFCNE